MKLVNTLKRILSYSTKTGLSPKGRGFGNEVPFINEKEIESFIYSLCKQDDSRLSNFYKEYWLDTGHIVRLVYLFKRIVPLLNPSQSLLDVGSFGEWPLLLWKYLGMRELHACSYEGDFIAYGKGRFNEKGDNDNEFELRIHRIDVEKQALPFDSQSLDVVTCFEVLEHLRLDPVFMMKEFNRVLKKDGLLILTTPNINSYESILRMVQYNTPCIFSRYFPDGLGIGHSKEYAVNEIKRLFDNCGFEVEALETFDCLPPAELNKGIIDDYKELKILLKQKGWNEELGGQNIFVIGRLKTAVSMRYYFPLYTMDKVEEN